MIERLNDDTFAGYGVDSSEALGTASAIGATVLTYVGDCVGPDGVKRRDYIDDPGPVPV